MEAFYHIRFRRKAGENEMQAADERSGLREFLGCQSFIIESGEDEFVDWALVPIGIVNFGWADPLKWLKRPPLATLFQQGLPWYGIVEIELGRLLVPRVWGPHSDPVFEILDDSIRQLWPFGRHFGILVTDGPYE